MYCQTSPRWRVAGKDNLEKLVNEIFQDKRHVLSHLKIERGSVFVTYSAPLSEADSLIMLALEQSSFLIKVGVSQLIVGEIIAAQNESNDFQFESSLIQAVEENDLDLLNFLLSINTSPDAANSDGWSALTVACYCHHCEAVALLLKANANPNLQTDSGLTPLYIASQKGLTDTITLLLKANANPNLAKNNGATPLFTASQKGHIDAITLLLKLMPIPIFRE